MASPLVAVVLICSASIAVQDCSVDNATDVTYGESASTVFECLASGPILGTVAMTVRGAKAARSKAWALARCTAFAGR